jgi:alpha-galactosidase
VKKINFDWKKHTIADPDFDYKADFTAAVYKIKDLWKNKDAGTTKKPYISELNPHDVITLKLIK